MSNATIEQTKSPESEWNAIAWNKLEYQVDRLQKRIFRVTQDKENLPVRSRSVKPPFLTKEYLRGNRRDVIPRNNGDVSSKRSR